jgi:hypothetical protein
LKLSAEQEKLWGPVEEALRNLQERTRDLRSSFGPGQPDDQIERLRRLGDLSAQRGDALKRLADAIQPLWATLSDEQKRELPRFVRVAAGQTDEDRMSGRGRDPGDRPGMEYRRRGGEGSDDPRGRMMGRGDEPNDQMSMGRRRQGGYRGDRDQRYEGSEQRGDRFGGYWGSQQDSRPREFDRDRRDFDRRSDSDGCRCYDRD